MIALSACSRGQNAGTASPSPSATAPATEAATAAAAAPAAEPSASPEPNLLSTANGTILRSYSPAALDRMNDGNLGNAAHGIGSQLAAEAKPPFVFTFELPGVAKIAQFQAQLRHADNGAQPSVTFAVSTTGAGTGFTDVGTVTADAGGANKTLAADAQARWVRVTANLELFDSVGATGTLAPPPAALDPTGFFVEESRPEKNGAFALTSDNDFHARAVAVGSAVTATECAKDRLIATYVGSFQGRSWTAVSAGNKDANPSKVRTVMNDDGSIAAGVTEGGSPIVFMRTVDRPKFCVPRLTGTGAHHVLVLDQDPMGVFYPADTDLPLRDYTFESVGAGMLDAAALRGKDAVIARDVCTMPALLAPQQTALLLDWVAAGHKLIISHGGGGCSKSDFTWLPFGFTSGSGPETGHASLIQVENNALGTNDANDAAHYVDVKTYVLHENNSLANANVMTTTDPRWCGHFFVAKPTNRNGFAQSYALDGKGLLIFDGFDNFDAAFAPLQRIRELELALPVGADLPCSQTVTESFVLEPSQEATFAAGTAKIVPAPMQVLANQGWSGHVTVKTTGDLAATVSPNAFEMAGGTQGLNVSIAVPVSQKPGVYTVTVIGDNGSGKTAQAAVTLTGTGSLRKQFNAVATQKRIRIYGIHFDVDSARIQPRSEPVIAEIAQIMHETPGLRFQVEGHTDSDGGVAYNLGLSQRRAQAVVDDLVKRYHIARGRLIPKGYGLTKPVAPNTTPAGKALNRRVELLRL